MTRAVFRVVFAGPHVSVQDNGRPRLMRYGVPASGPMDRKAFAIANAVLGNDPGAAGLEVSQAGLVLECLSGTVTVAIAGGGFIVERNREKLGAWNIFTVEAGQTIKVRTGQWGCWSYLAFAGTVQVESWLGSSATHGPSGLGAGRLTTGQTITISDTHIYAHRLGAIPCPVWARPRNMMHCVLGPQDRFFPKNALAEFTSAQFHLTDAYDRMGMRLHGPALHSISALSIPSEPILRGSVQISGDGVATILLADHQTTGGYPKIATILSDDVDGLVQGRPHDAIRFKSITAHDAVALARNRARMFTDYLRHIAKSYAKAAGG